jgi:hypothetical protein
MKHKRHITKWAWPDIRYYRGIFFIDSVKSVKSSIRISYTLVEIKTRNLSNSKQNCYLFDHDIRLYQQRWQNKRSCQAIYNTRTNIVKTRCRCFFIFLTFIESRLIYTLIFLIVSITLVYCKYFLISIHAFLVENFLPLFKTSNINAHVE